MNRIPFGLVCNLLEIFIFRIGTTIANIIVIRIQIKNRLVARIIRKKSIVSKDERSMSRKIFPFINTRIFKTYRVCTGKIFDTAIKFSIILYDDFFQAIFCCRFLCEVKYFLNRFIFIRHNNAIREIISRRVILFLEPRFGFHSFLRGSIETIKNIVSRNISFQNYSLEISLNTIESVSVNGKSGKKKEGLFNHSHYKGSTLYKI